MSHQYLKNYHDFISIPMKNSWTKCTVGLEHSVSGDYYWLSCSVRFYIGEESDHMVFLGGGSKSNANLFISTLEAFGFEQSGRSIMREWEYTSYQRLLNPQESN